WWLPILAVDYIFGAAQLAAIGYFFSQLAVVTFGGAYAVLAYMAQDVVGQLGWLQAGTMMDGLGLAETTPGPLILVTEFVGFVTAFNAGGLAYGIAGAAIAVWATFIPCFLWIFVGAPYIEWLTHQPRLQAALSSIMAAVVGVIANLFLWFALHIVFMRISHETVGPFTLLIPDITSADMTTITIAAACSVVAFWRKAGLFTMLMVAAGFGILSGMITL
ncbi:MAG: chromate transporter, partial [Candidatus Puniceispirillaceae bacterium]